MAWTNDQLKAIKTRNGKVIVSAAAGSGKTAVLSQRVLDFILQGGNINRLLVVTFTDAAAMEMKVRIKKNIEQKLLEEKENEHLLKQLVLIDTAKICTMDSFYSEIVKQNFDKLGIRSNFTILSSAQENILKNKIVKELMNDYMDDEAFLNILNILGAKNDDLIKDKIICVSNFLSTIPFYKDYLNMVIENYENDYYKNEYLNLLKNKINSYKDLYLEVKEELFNESSDFDKLANNINEEIELINRLLSINNFNDLSLILRTFEFSKQATIRGHSEDFVFNKYKALRSKFKDEITKKLIIFKNINEDEYNNQMIIMKNVLIKLFEVVIEFNERVLNEKKKVNMFSFNDIPHFVIELLVKDGKRTSVSEELSNMFDEILIDEYQDTNKLQNIIFNSISKDEENLFIVGDIKQSIYRFRSACPEIFNDDKKRSFKDKFPMLITLSKNFRSRDLVLDFCNFVFESTMSSYLGEVNYDDNEKLYVGADFPVNNKMISEINIIDNEEKDEEDELSNRQKEAILVANKIKDLLDNKFQVYDKKGFYRDIKPSDIAILFRSLSNSDVYRIALENRNIGVYCDKNLSFFDNYDVMLIISLLKVIDNLYDDISLMSVLKSDIFNVTDEEIAEIRISNKNEYLFQSILKSNNEKLKEILNILNEFNNYSKNNTLLETINFVYKKLDIFNKIATNKYKIKNLTLMLKNISDFEKDGLKTIKDLVSYIDDLILDKSSFEGANPLSDGENVLMTTIHRSKGLEYPVVFLCETASKFNDKDLKSDFLIDSNYGIGFDVFDNKKLYRYETIPTILLKNKMKLSSLSEELRVLYVALTRAREKLIITGSVGKLKNMVLEASYMIGDNLNINHMYLENSNTYLSWLIGAILKHEESKKLQDYCGVYTKTFASDAKFNLNIISAKDIKDENLSDVVSYEDNFELEELKDYDESLSLVPLNLSVSKIKSKDYNFYRKPYFLDSDVKNTNVGTLYHKVFELLPIKKYSISSLKEEIESLNISSDEKKIINIEKVLAYLTSDLYNIVLNSDKVYKEKEIYFQIQSNIYDSNLKDGNILIDGIIDLLCENDGEYIIVDYKTDKASNIEDLVILYKKQLDLYEIAIKEKYNAKNVSKYIYSIFLNKYIKL